MKWIILCLCILIVALLAKIIVLKKSVRKIRTDFVVSKKGDSNRIITIDCRDRDILQLVTDMNETLDEIRKYYLLYHEGDAEMKTAITNISHDLRTPLTAISGYLELLKPMEKSKEVEQYISIIEERTTHMKKLTEEMFEYSVIASAQTEETILEEVDVNRAIEDCVMEYYGAIMERNIDLKVDITEKRIIRRLNKVQIERVFSNLISNALKYSDGDLSISMNEEGIIVFANKAKSLSKVSVEHLFGRFYTVENARNSTGLGLSIAKTFVERMNGTIRAEYEQETLSIILTFS